MVRPTVLKDGQVVNLYLEREQIKYVRESGMSISSFIRKIIDENMGKLNLYKTLEDQDKEIKKLKKKIPKKEKTKIITI